jgi:DNA-binding transcriptional MerR regulator
LSDPIHFTLDELVAAIDAELDRLEITPADPRAAERPDARTLRYYTTIGLLDPPLERRARRAIYGRRHLRQAVAIKRLQADGATLEEVQQRLAGLDDRALDEVVIRGDGPVVHIAAGLRAPLRVPVRARAHRRDRFWADARASAPPAAPNNWTSHPRVVAALEELAAAIDAARRETGVNDDD